MSGAIARIARMARNAKPVPMKRVYMAHDTGWYHPRPSVPAICLNLIKAAGRRLRIANRQPFLRRY